MRKRYVLPLGVRYKLTRYIDENWEKIEKDKPTQQEMAESLRPILHWEKLNRHHVHGATKTLGKRWPCSSRVADSGIQKDLILDITTVLESLVSTVPVPQNVREAMKRLLHSSICQD